MARDFKKKGSVSAAKSKGKNRDKSVIKKKQGKEENVEEENKNKLIEKT